MERSSPGGGVRRRWLRAVVCAAIGAAPIAAGRSPGHAAARDESISYEAPKECGSAGAFAARVGERTGRPTKLATAARHRVKILRTQAGFHGTLTVVDDGATHERAVDGRTCGEVFDALALVTAMAFEAPDEDPASSASGGASASGSASASASASVAAGEPTGDRGRAEGDGGDREPGADAFGIVRLPPPAPSSSTPTASPWSIGASFDLVALDGAPPLGGAVYGEWAADSTRGIAPSLRLGLSRTWARRDVAIGGSLGLSWLFGAIDACATRASGPFRVDACGVAHAGALSATPDGVPEGRTAARGWLALGGATRGRVHVAGGLYLELLVALMAPLTRDRFVVNGSAGGATQTYSAPAMQLFGGLGLGFQIP